uniref:PLAC8 like 1 n=1 Tax=Cynoglossus semilaevis TaxID=244447 RepID=A0A3P8WAT6_CYNSE
MLALSSPTHHLTGEVSLCLSLHLLVSADSLFTLSCLLLLSSPLCGCPHCLVMDQTTVRYQPVPSDMNESSVFETGDVATGCKYTILTQPGLGVTTTTITTITQTGGGWSTGLFDICEDKTTCVLGALVPCCLDLSLAHQFGECLWLPLLPGSTFGMRVGIRERYKIRVSARSIEPAVFLVCIFCLCAFLFIIMLCMCVHRVMCVRTGPQCTAVTLWPCVR